jgi:hypothetical protein
VQKQRWEPMTQARAQQQLGALVPQHEKLLPAHKCFLLEKLRQLLPKGVFCE